MATVKLAFTSDLHLPITPAVVIGEMARAIAAFAPDALAVLGDIGESLAAIEACLRILKSSVACPVVVVAGNHDLWLPERGPGRSSSLLRFQEELPRTVAETGCTWLEGEGYLIGNVALAGTIAWYDYSAVDPNIGVSAEILAQRKQFYNVDALRIRWPCTDPEFAGMVAEPFLATLDRLEADPAVRQTVVVTHVPLLECQILRKPNDKEWGFSNAYFGNLTLGEQVIQRPKVTHIISGHTHIGRHALVKLTDGRPLDVHVLDSRYGSPVWLGRMLPD